MMNRRYVISAMMLLGVGIASAQELRIISAQYGHDNRWADVTDIVRRSTMRGRLDIIVGNQTFGMDPAPAEFKSLRIEYRLNGQPMRDEFPENTRVILPRGEMRRDDDDRRRGPEGGLQILSAQYGSRNRRVDVDRLVRAYVRDGQLRMRINNDTMGGDPDRGADKRLRVEYVFNGQRDVVEVGEDNDLILPRPGIMGAAPPPPPPPAYGPPIRILSAGYGARDHFVDVTRILRDRIAPDGTLRVHINNDVMGGDPFRGADKVLRVDYEFQGQRLHRDVREGGDLILP